FYVWTPDELSSALGADGPLFMRVYGVTPAGNFEHGTSILHRVEGESDAARALGLGEDEARRRLSRARAVLLELRAKRPRPHRDDKVLAAWNGLMISAYARGA